MKITHAYTLRFLFIALSLMFASGLWVWGWLEKWPPICLHLSAITAVVLTVSLVKLAHVIPDQVKYFLSSLLRQDYMMHFSQTRDEGMNRMYADMNRITAIYKERLMDIEYKQLYYDRLLRIMTHELRNSITPVISLSDDLLKYADCYTPEEIHESMEVIHAQCVGAKTFLDSYSRLAHLPVPVKKEVEVEKLFAQLQVLLPYPSLHFVYGKGIRLFVDTDLLIQVLTNLIKNAHEAIDGQSDAYIEVVASESENHPYMLVRDNGPGIPEEQKEEIFLPFYTTKSHGTGIGLCLSRQIMRQHGGDLKLIPPYGRGATFMLTL